MYNTITTYHNDDGMTLMNIRATYALDLETSRMIKQLAQQWNVSQAEVIRRTIRQAATGTQGALLSPANVIEHYRNQELPRTCEQTATLVRALRDQRHADDSRRSRRDSNDLL